MSKKVSNLTIQPVANTEQKTVYASWTFSTANTKKCAHYTYVWYYATGDYTTDSSGDKKSVWWKGDEGTVSAENKKCQYSYPDSAVKVYVKVKPVSKNPKGKRKRYWTGAYVSASVYTKVNQTPSTPSMSTPTLDTDGTLTVEVTGYSDTKATSIEFQLSDVADNTSTSTSDSDSVSNSHKITLSLGYAKYTTKLTDGHFYRIRCRAVGIWNSEWTAYSDKIGGRPTPPSDISIVGTTNSMVTISWTCDSEKMAESGATIEYSDDKSYFETRPDNVVQLATLTKEQYYIGKIDKALTKGNNYWLRMQSINANGLGSEWVYFPSNGPFCYGGEKPDIPTTWTNATYYYIGEDVYLYWSYNSSDGATHSYSTVYVTVNGVTKTYNFNNLARSENDREKICSYKLDTSSYTNGATIKWKVTCTDVTGLTSDNSVEREITIYSKPAIGLTTNLSGDVLTSFPLTVTAKLTPSTQEILSYGVTITANNDYEGEDVVGNTNYVSSGDVVYSISENGDGQSATITLTPYDVTLEDSEEYTLTFLVTTNVGLSAEETVIFSVNQEVEDLDITCIITLDDETFQADLWPYVEIASDDSDVSDGDDEDEDDVIDIADLNLVENITISIYRFDTSGEFTEIATGIQNDALTHVIDPHPQLDNAKYRVVAINTNTGSMVHDDVYEPFGESAIVINWGERFKEKTMNNTQYISDITNNGVTLTLPWNIETTETSEKDVVTVSYLGRKHPVSYYGTQLGFSTTWKCVIDKKDTDTRDLLRELMSVMEDVYVRSPDGLGFWAVVNVSMDEKYSDLTTAVTITPTRVEGGR